MPHLSPMNWLILPLSFWLILLSLMSMLWWSQSPQFPPITSSSNDMNHNKWNW